LPASGVPAANQPMLPAQLSSIDIESAGQRAIPRQASTVFIVAQVGDVPSAGAVVLEGVLTCLWLLR
jgi:hypothetical protein